MSTELGTYSFLPWLRHGLANTLQVGGGMPRATISVSLALDADAIGGGTQTLPIQKNVQLYGPGDIVGIDSRAIIRTEPRPWITNFEPNYLPCIDFYEEDFPWRYTPELPSGHRLRPWIMLVVLKEDEFEEGPVAKDRPLPHIVVGGAAGLFPPIDQVWAWAHVHVNRDLGASPAEIVSANMDAVLPKFTAAVQQNPDLAYSRIVCPRKLDANVPYHAFLLPVFETGRLAGLGRDPSTTPAVSHGAWQPDAGKPEPDAFPYYYRWAFKTGTVGDFEYLVRLLEPRPMDSRVGQRDIDVQEPGANLSGITDPELHGVLRLGGALRVPFVGLTDEERDIFCTYETWNRDDYPHPFQEDLAAFINLADDYSRKAPEDAHADTAFDATIPDPANPGAHIDDPDPLITPPLFGRWHALTARLLTAPDGSNLANNDNWVHQLNLDPRHRTSAGFGTAVIQQNQEAYMNAAWEQIGDVLEANRRIRLAQLAKLTSQRWQAVTLQSLAGQEATAEKALLLTAPVQRRVLYDGNTVYYQVKTSPLTEAITTVASRRVLRPRGRLMRALPFDDDRTRGNLLTRLNDGEVLAAPPKSPLEGAPTVNDLADRIDPRVVPLWARTVLRRNPDLWKVFVALMLLCLLLAVLVFPLGLVFALVLVALAIASGGASAVPRLWVRSLQPYDRLREENQTPAAVDTLPMSPEFHVFEPGEDFSTSTGDSDSPEATKFKEALSDLFDLTSATPDSAPPVDRRPLVLDELRETVVAALDPAVTIPRHTYHDVTLPPRIREQIGERFVEAMAYPEIDTPMYKPLADKSVDYFLPNIEFIGQNTISLLETNQPFIEAYMVGLNHEFARELLWREYVTDQRGSYFRQFWDVSGYLDAEDLDATALREKLKDIPPLHRWSQHSRLGDHDHREAPGATGSTVLELCQAWEGGEPGTTPSGDEVVLVIRGELLKKYPTAVIYAHRARWQRNQDGTINPKVERRLEDPTAANGSSPPRSIVKTPLYEAKVDPDIYFFGFDLTVAEARGGTGESETDDPGWFFVIKERPGEPRFGLDIDRADTVFVWNDLGWGNVIANPQPGDYLQITAATPTITLSPLPATETEQAEQAADDKFVRWHKDTDAAELAYILYQVPVLVAVHAAEMLLST